MTTKTDWGKDKICPGCGKLIWRRSHLCSSCAIKHSWTIKKIGWKSKRKRQKNKLCPDCGKIIWSCSERCHRCMGKRRKDDENFLSIVRHNLPHLRGSKHPSWKGGANAARNRQMNNHCLDCNKKIYNRSKRCRSCAFKNAWKTGRFPPKMTEDHRRKIGKANSGENNHFWNGGHTCKGKYLMKYIPSHPHAYNGKYIPEHRLVAEKIFGRRLKPQEIVHHINQNPKDNRISNLLICDRKKHMKIHQDLIDKVRYGNGNQYQENNL